MGRDAKSDPSTSVERRPLTLRLRDGTPILVRPIVPEDKALLRDGLRRLSPESRYRRFLAAISELSHSQLKYLTEVDYINHMAWVALEVAKRTHAGIGVARYVRLEDDAEAAEVAVTVVDSHQSRGVGTVLLGLLSRSAAEHGITTFVAYVLPENRRMLNLFRDLGAKATRQEERLIRVEIPVPKDLRSLPTTPAGRVFNAVAREMARAGKTG